MYSTELENVSYALGVNIAQSMQKQGLTEIDSTKMAQGIKDTIEGSALAIPEESIQMVLQSYFQKLQDKQFAKNIEAGKVFLANNAKREEVTVLDSGLQYEVIQPGSGERPKATDTVTTHYHGSLIDGTVFDSSIERGKPASFPVNGVIPGWVEALQLMEMGAKWKLYIPGNLAYGANPHPGGPIEPHATLIFDIELIAIGG